MERAAMSDSKTLQHVEIKSGDRGEFTAVIASFDCVDSDGDVVRRSAFTERQDVVVSAYGHQSWSGVLPVGHAQIHTTPTEALADGLFLMSTTGGRETFQVVKHLAERGLGQWSWGFSIEDEERGTFEGRPVRFLNRVMTHEVSPVLRGASVGTRTLATKGVAAMSPEDVVAREFAKFVEWELAQDIAAELREIRDQHDEQEFLRTIAQRWGMYNG
jgi:hypothetical protein